MNISKIINNGMQEENLDVNSQHTSSDVNDSNFSLTRPQTLQPDSSADTSDVGQLEENQQSSRPTDIRQEDSATDENRPSFILINTNRDDTVVSDQQVQSRMTCNSVIRYTLTFNVNSIAGLFDLVVNCPENDACVFVTVLDDQSVLFINQTFSRLVDLYFTVDGVDLAAFSPLFDSCVNRVESFRKVVI